MRRLAALLLTGFSVTAAYAQAPNERTKERQESKPGNVSSTHARMHRVGVDREAAIGHALGMAIEGSALWHFAQQAETKEAKTDHKAGNPQAMRDPGAILEQHARDAFHGSERLFQAVMQDEQAADRGTKHNDRDDTAAASNTRQASDHMASHQACEEFYRAARDYSRALETSCSKTRQAGGQSSASISSEVCAENTAKVALINCAVKDAVQGVALQQMLRHHGEHDRTTQALESHAEQMLTTSRHTIDSIEKATTNNGQSNNIDRQHNSLASNDKERAGDKDRARNDQGTTIRREAARPNYDDERAHSNLKAGEAITVHQLAKLGREVIRSVDRLNQNQEHMKK